MPFAAAVSELHGRVGNVLGEVRRRGLVLRRSQPKHDEEPMRTSEA